MKHPQQAFSLVEVMCAILILGVAVVALTGGITTALSSSKEGEVQTVAALFASGKIELTRVEGAIAEGETRGDCGEELPLYRWKQTVTRTTLEGLHEVSVQIESSRTGDQIFELKTLLFEEPLESEPPKSRGQKETSRSRRREGRR